MLKIWFLRLKSLIFVSILLIPTSMKTTTKKIVCKSMAVMALIAGISSVSEAQTIFFNNGAQIFTASAAIVQVNGGFQNDGAAGTTPVFENNGTMTIANSGTPGSVFLTNGSTLQGDGTIFVEQDWTNDATFTADNSTVNFNGDLQQFITSTIGTVTTFNNLTLSGAGATVADRKKTLQLVNARVGTSGILTINDRELETQTNTMFIDNPAVTAVTNTTTFGAEGFVSSAFGGTLSNLSSVYHGVSTPITLQPDLKISSFNSDWFLNLLRYSQSKKSSATLIGNAITGKKGIVCKTYC